MAQPTEGVRGSEESANPVQSSNVLTLLEELKAAHALIRELQDEKTRRTTVSPAGKASHSGGNARNGNTHHTWASDNELHKALSLSPSRSPTKYGSFERSQGGQQWQISA